MLTRCKPVGRSDVREDWWEEEGDEEGEEQWASRLVSCRGSPFDGFDERDEDVICGLEESDALMLLGWG